MKIRKRTKIKLYRAYRHVLCVSLIGLWGLSLITLAISLYTLILFPLLWMAIPDVEQDSVPVEVQDEKAKIDDDCLITLREYHS